MHCKQGHLMVPICEFELSATWKEIAFGGEWFFRNYTVVPESLKTWHNTCCRTKYGMFVLIRESAPIEEKEYTLFKCLRCSEESKVPKQSYLSTREKKCPKCGTQFWGIPPKCWKCHSPFPRVPTLSFRNTLGFYDDPMQGGLEVVERFGSLYTPEEWREFKEGDLMIQSSVTKPKTSSIAKLHKGKWWQFWR